MKLHTAGFLLAILLIVSAGFDTAYAQSDWEDFLNDDPYDDLVGIAVGPHLGYQKATDADSGDFMAGLTLRARLTPFLGVEGSISYRKEDYVEESVEVVTWPVQVTGLFYPLPILYGAVGAGWYNTTIDYDLADMDLGEDTSQEFGWHFGAGIDLPFSELLRLSADIRYVFLDYEFEEIPGTDEIESDFYMITLLLLFQL